MSARIGIVFAALLACTASLFIPPAAADTNQTASPAAGALTVERTPQQACPVLPDQRLDLAQGLPTDCCKGHKGICGCRAGKIVCCDGSVSTLPNCTCHSDWGVAN